MRSWLRRVAGLCAAGLALAAAAQAQIAVPRETVERRVSARGAFAWSARYDAEVRDGTVWIRVFVHLVPGAGVSRPEVERAAGPWRAAIRRAWDDRLVLELPSGASLPIRVEVSFRGPRFHHQVVVGRGRRRTDPLHWALSDPAELVAHEFGHLLGAYDDYPGGAVGPKGPISDPESIMRAGPTSGLARPRHLAGVAEWFAQRTGLAGRVVSSERHGPGETDGDGAPGRAGALQHDKERP